MFFYRLLWLLLSTMLMAVISLGQQQEYVIISSYEGISVFSVTSSTGLLNTVSGSPFAVPGSYAVRVAADPMGRFVYAPVQSAVEIIPGGDANAVAGYRINVSTGALTPVPGSPVAAGTVTNQVGVHPSGLFLYAVNEGSLDVNGYQIDQLTGALTPLPGSPYQSDVSGFDIAFDPTGSYAFVASNYGGIAVFSINQTTGALTPVPGSPFNIGSNLCSVAVHPNGHFVYVADCDGEVIWGLQFTQNQFMQLPGSPYYSGLFPHWISISHAGSALYVSNTHGNSVSGYQIDQSTGALTAVTGSPFPGGSQPDSIAVDTTDRFAYQVDEGDQSIWSYVISSQTGALAANGSPVAFSGSGGSNSVIVVRPTSACVIPPSGTAIPGAPVSWNGFSAPAGSVVWINAHISNPGNVPTNTITTVDFTGVTLVVNTTSYALPNGEIVFNPATSTPSTVVNAGGSWTTTVNPSQSGNIFFVGQAIPVDSNLENGGNGNTGSTLSFTTNSSDSDLQFQWQWGAAVYTSWSGNTAANIEPIEANGLHAGAPQNPVVQKDLIQGPRGGGGSNFTGSWSGTGKGVCPQ